MNPAPYDSKEIRAAWRNLAADVLLLAIREATESRDPQKRKKARSWLLSKTAQLYFSILDVDIDFYEWVLKKCPNLEEK